MKNLHPAIKSVTFTPTHLTQREAEQIAMKRNACMGCSDYMAFENENPAEGWSVVRFNADCTMQRVR